MGENSPWLGVDIYVKELPSLGIVCISFILKDQPAQSSCKHSSLVYRFPSVAFQLGSEFIFLGL